MAGLGEPISCHFIFLVKNEDRTMATLDLAPLGYETQISQKPARPLVSRSSVNPIVDYKTSHTVRRVC